MISGAVVQCLLPPSLSQLNPFEASVRTFTPVHSFIFSHPFTNIHPI